MKLPINLLLSVAILGLLAGIGWHFYFAWQEKEQGDKGGDRVRTTFESIVKRGADLVGEVADGPDWSRATFWENFREANFTGKEPPVVVEAPPVQQEEIKPKVAQPLEDIIAIMCIYYDGDESRVIVRYKPAANVEPPPELLAALNPPRDTLAPTPDPRAPGGRRGSPAPATMPSFGDPGQGYVHHVALEDTLWKNYERIRLVRVAADASHAVFVREDAAVDKKEWKEEALYPEALGLDQDVLAALRAGRIITSDAQIPATATPVEPNEFNPWIAGPLTREVGRNEFHVGTDDRDQFQRDPQRIFNEDIGTVAYSGKSIKGVQITRLAPGYARYGVQVGDVVISVNGEPVRNQQHGYKVGMEMYGRGVRKFVVEFLSRGQRVERTYVLPDK
jgi:hypothetical protein